jgi:uncharacterized repeat protein (TIGR04076 family)
VPSLSKCKVTVLRRGLDRELIAEFISDEYAEMGRCEALRDGQEFIVEQVDRPPDGLCPWAWADIRHVIARVAAGGDLPGMRRQGVEIAGCTDWFRPVIFKIERIE